LEGWQTTPLVYSLLICSSSKGQGCTSLLMPQFSFEIGIKLNIGDHYIFHFLYIMHHNLYNLNTIRKQWHINCDEGEMRTCPLLSICKMGDCIAICSNEEASRIFPYTECSILDFVVVEIAIKSNNNCPNLEAMKKHL